MRHWARVWLAVLLLGIGGALADVRDAIADQPLAAAAGTSATDACCAGPVPAGDAAVCAPASCAAGCPAILAGAPELIARSASQRGCELDLSAESRVALLEPHPPRFFSASF